ncbi:hypothetical protein H8E88_19255 [candidate division KSB1 bacterium]|nr:hypothetical protein [candidate division KSB1 bacterium]
MIYDVVTNKHAFQIDTNTRPFIKNGILIFKEAKRFDSQDPFVQVAFREWDHFHPHDHKESGILRIVANG